MFQQKKLGWKSDSEFRKDKLTKSTFGRLCSKKEEKKEMSFRNFSVTFRQHDRSSSAVLIFPETPPDFFWKSSESQQLWLDSKAKHDENDLVKISSVEGLVLRNGEQESRWQMKHSPLVQSYKIIGRLSWNSWTVVGIKPRTSWSWSY